MVTLLTFLPLIGAIISGFFRITRRSATVVSSGFMVISALISVIIFYQVIYSGDTYIVELFKWLSINNLDINISLKIDPLTALMLTVITIVSSLVHIYSIGYMSDDPSINRFMSYLSLFTFSMIMLVTSDNFLQLFFGWEAVGLCSYLLIGFWYKKSSANNASMKAFIVNRVGDVAFLLGIFLIYTEFNSLSFENIFSNSHSFSGKITTILGHDFLTLDIISMLLFIGSMGKSAQIFLHTWLPDAMEGPTPVSALIHAATMVTAGVFLLARCSPIFEYAYYTKDLIVIIGSITCLFAASIALTQFDIKKIIAYSTCSQLGYMFAASGVSAYNAAMFHLATHAFFKALLFLGAGSVIHAVTGEQDIRNMGGLRKYLPKTYILMLVGSLSIAGIWPFSGFFSKDIILETLYASGTSSGMFAYILGLVAASFTSFYSWRLLILVFMGGENFKDKHPHESPKVMIYPLYILAFGAILTGIFYTKLGIVESSGKFFGESIFIKDEPNILERAHHVSIFVKLSPLFASLLGIVTSYIFYFKSKTLPNMLSSKFSSIYNLIYNKYYFDELYDIVFVKNIRKIGNYFSEIIDNKVIDNFGPNNFARISQNLSILVGRLQSGYLYHYAPLMLLGLIIIINWYIFRNSY